MSSSNDEPDNRNLKNRNIKYKKKTKKVSEDTKKEVLAYKYSKKGTETLYEAIILDGRPNFVTWYPDYGISNENIRIHPFIEEPTRIIRPPNLEEYPYGSYEFADEQELRSLNVESLFGYSFGMIK